jgi:hypothetical protein
MEEWWWLLLLFYDSEVKVFTQDWLKLEKQDMDFFLPSRV